MKPDTDTKWTTPSEAARLAGVSPQWIVQLCRTGRLVHKKTPLGRLILLVDVVRLSEERRRKRANS